MRHLPLLLHSQTQLLQVEWHACSGMRSAATPVVSSRTLIPACLHNTGHPSVPAEQILEYRALLPSMFCASHETTAALGRRMQSVWLVQLLQTIDATHLQLGNCHWHISLILQVQNSLVVEVVPGGANERADGPSCWISHALRQFQQVQGLVCDLYKPPRALCCLCALRHDCSCDPHLVL